MRKFSPRRLCAAFAIVLVAASLAAAAKPKAKAKAKPTDKGPAAADATTVEGVLGSAELAGAKVGIVVQSLADGRVLLSKNPDQPLIPASTNKIVTGAAALDVLGPKYQFRTEIYIDGKLAADGTVNGNIYVKGTGDPSTTIEETWLIAHRVWGHGVRAVTGDVIADDSRFSPERWYGRDVWNYPNPAAYTQPMGALAFNYNTVQAHVAPASGEGAKAHVTLEPDNSYYQLDNQVTTCAKCKSVLSMHIEGRTATVTGQIAAGAEPWTTFQPVSEPAEFAAAAFRSLIEKEGVKVAGAARRGEVPAGARLLFRHESRDLSLIVRYMMRWSNNFAAEQLFKAVGAHASGAQGSRETGIAGVQDFMTRNGLWREGVVIADGSGLSKLNRQTPSSLVAILTWAANRPEVFPELVESMAVAGSDGTLRKRFRGTPLEGRVRAKTGYVGGVICLAGYAWSPRGEPFAFAMMVNNPGPGSSVGGVRNAIDRILVLLLS